MPRFNMIYDTVALHMSTGEFQRMEQTAQIEAHSNKNAELYALREINAWNRLAALHDYAGIRYIYVLKLVTEK